jgi:hypothetical protein
METRPRKLLDQVRDIIRVKHYSYRTEESYVYWIRRYILFHQKRHPREMGDAELEAFLTHLAIEEHVAASTQNQVLNAIVFLYREVLKQDLGIQIESIRPNSSEAATRCHAISETITIKGFWKNLILVQGKL